jgi:starch phosphorylase
MNIMNQHIAPAGGGRAMDSAGLRDDILHHLKYSLGKDPGMRSCMTGAWRCLLAVRDRIVDPWFAATRETYAGQHKRVYYLSMEFLIGRLLGDAIVNLGLLDAAQGGLRRFGCVLRCEVLTNEPDAALGNGGLGRLAACFLDSLSTLGMSGFMATASATSTACSASALSMAARSRNRKTG